jgi:DNA invertase Pin-like site-specific DNA recombinase
MRTTALLRYSTDQQTKDQQLYTVNQYLRANNIVADNIIEESEHGDIPFMQRELGRVIMQSEQGDRIIVSEYTRFNRSIDDSFAMIRAIKERGVVLYAIKENLELDGRNGDDVMLYMQTLINASSASKELENIRSRTKAGMAVKKHEIATHGYFIAKRSGNRIEKLGNTTNLEEAQKLGREMSVIARRKSALENKKLRQAWMAANLLKESGRKNAEIISELNESGFKTLSGGKFSTKNIKRFIQTYKKIYAS